MNIRKIRNVLLWSVLLSDLIFFIQAFYTGNLKRAITSLDFFGVLLAFNSAALVCFFVVLTVEKISANKRDVKLVEEKTRVQRELDRLKEQIREKRRDYEEYSAKEEKARRDYRDYEARTKVEEAAVADAVRKQTEHLNAYSVFAHVDVFLKQTATMTRWIGNGEEENKVFDLYLSLREALEKASKIPLEKRAQIPEQHKQLNEVETLMDLYSEKIQRVRDDEALDDEEREEKIAYWRDLRNKQIADIRGS